TEMAGSVGGVHEAGVSARGRRGSPGGLRIGVDVRGPSRRIGEGHGSARLLQTLQSRDGTLTLLWQGQSPQRVSGARSGPRKAWGPGTFPATSHALRRLGGVFVTETAPRGASPAGPVTEILGSSRPCDLPWISLTSRASR